MSGITHPVNFYSFEKFLPSIPSIHVPIQLLIGTVHWWRKSFRFASSSLGSGWYNFVPIMVHAASPLWLIEQQTLTFSPYKKHWYLSFTSTGVISLPFAILGSSHFLMVKSVDPLVWLLPVWLLHLRLVDIPVVYLISVIGDKLSCQLLHLKLAGNFACLYKSKNDKYQTVNDKTKSADI